MQPLPPKLESSRAWRSGLAWLLAACVVIAAVLFLFDPAQHSFYPRCTLKALTGLDCPGCGGLRATHQLLHGNIAAAFRLNPLLVTLGPLAGAWLLRAGARGIRRREFPQLRIAPPVAWLLFAGALAFSIFRNLPIVAR